MFWYIVICILMLYPFYLDRTSESAGKDTRPLVLAIACGILWFFMAMRDISVGVDTKYYSYVYQQFADIPFSKVFTAVTYATENKSWAFDFEPGYRLVNKLLSYFFPAPQAITIFNSTVIMALLYRLIRRESTHYMLSIWLYITLGIYQTEMNVTRNAIAILIVYNGFTYLRRRAFWKYLLVCVAASLFHVAALALIPVYWLVHHFRLTIKKCLVIVTSACVVGLLFPYIAPYVRMITPRNLDKYFYAGNESLASILVGMFNGGVFAMCYCLMRPSERSRVLTECAPGVVMLLLNLCFFGLNIGLEDASRMAALFGPFTLLLIPRMIDMIESPVRRKNAVVLVSVVCGCVYILRMCINNIGGTMPYAFFW